MGQRSSVANLAHVVLRTPFTFKPNISNEEEGESPLETPCAKILGSPCASPWSRRHSSQVMWLQPVNFQVGAAQRGQELFIPLTTIPELHDHGRAHALLSEGRRPASRTPTLSAQELLEFAAALRPAALKAEMSIVVREYGPLNVWALAPPERSNRTTLPLPLRRSHPWTNRALPCHRPCSRFDRTSTAARCQHPRNE